MWGLTPIDQAMCRIRFKQARFEGTMTPLGIDRPTLTWPGYLGGIDWGGISVDKGRHLMFVNNNRVSNYNRLLTRATADRLGVKPMTAAHMSDRSEEHTSELQSLMRISYAVLCLTKKTKYHIPHSKNYSYN